ncbi:Uncharacterised protein [Mycoplasmopsis gallopavonis]|uniref:Uncharacterized protein n=1 Tax=Mycoplasmopsis gallopavonis TaxID=76629 RepID=A0A449AZH7_9BACT|nr:hypothetical protein [Mycoplasmopsis gallopavonis]VEU72923.1 Uncharacterised protein [Mycoplasmopsis gallopavonis]
MKIVDKNKLLKAGQEIHLNNNEYVISKKFVKKGRTIRGAIAWESNFVNSKEFIHNFDLLLKDSSGNIVFSSNSSNKNIEYIKFITKKDDTYTWILRNSENNKINPEGIEIAFTETEGDR